ncbi:MAG: hypothetical protein GYA24_14200 [Candidatus Lokiarchaeota archaeon]|nr:hypothetical protein [Candidatus Lokiarchaeota archaeon]
MARSRRGKKAWLGGALVLVVLGSTLSTLAFFQQIQPSYAATIDFSAGTRCPSSPCGTPSQSGTWTRSRAGSAMARPRRCTARNTRVSTRWCS